MTIQNTDRSITYTGNGITKNFDYEFRIPDAESAYVLLIDKTTGAETPVGAGDYDITGLGTDLGGVVTYPKSGSPDPAIDSNTQIIIYREVPQTQTVSVENLAKYDAGVVEGVWDRIVMMVQDLVGRFTYSLRYPEGDTAENILPTAAARANQFFFFDANGDPAFTPSVVGAVTTPWSENFLLLVSSAEAVTELGLDVAFNMQTGTQGTILSYNDLGALIAVTGTSGQVLRIDGAGDAEFVTLESLAREFTKTQNFDQTTLTDAANIAWDLELNQVAEVTLEGNRTLDNPTNMKAGATYILTVKQDGTGSRTLAFGSAYKFPGGEIPTLTSDANAVDIITCVSDGTEMRCVWQGDFK